MRIVCVSDTHGCHNELTIPDGDIFIHCGDFSMMGEYEDLMEFNKWLGTLPHKRKIVIGGNHDFILEKDYYFNVVHFSNATYLEDNLLELDGLRIYGSPYTPRFGDWAFMRDRGNEMAKIWSKIPKDVDILITHGPPYGILDVTKGGLKVGCLDLLGVINTLKPKIHLFGHIHESYGTIEKNGTKFYNCALMNAYYDIVNGPVVIEV